MTTKPPHFDESMSASSRFAPVHLTTTRLDDYHAAARQALSHTVREFVKLDKKSMDTKRWKYLRSRGSVGVYLDRRQEEDTQNSSLLVVGNIPARLNDVMEGLYMDTSEDTRLVQHRFHPRFVDAEVLHVVERRSVERPYNFTGLKWSLLKSSSTGIVSNRDLCFLEKLGTVDIGGGRTLGYFIMQSVNLPECPPSLSSKVVRAHISLCYLFEEMDNGHVGVCMTGNLISFGPKILWSMARNNFADVVLSVGNTAKIARAKRYARLMRSKYELQVANPTYLPSLKCELCDCLPSFFERHKECNGCLKASVCKKCRGKRDVFIREDSVSLRMARATFCAECVRSVYEQPPQTPSVVAPRRTTRKEPVHSTRTKVSTQQELPQPVMQSSFASSTISTASEDESFSDRESERSLHLFTLQVQEEVATTGYEDTDLMTRLSGIVVLGDQEPADDSELERGSGETSASVASSGLSVFDDDDDGLEPDHEYIMSIKPVRRSVQPPEMLEAQKLSRDGTVRPRRPVSHSAGNNFELMSQLARVTRLAEETHQFTKEQTRRAEMQFNTPPRAYSFQA